jgi:bifunctional non-homologous end joining protein LigD
MRTGKVLVDWMQTDDGKTTVSVYSVRAAHDRPSVSAPLTWDELDAAVESGDTDAFLLGPDEVLERVAADGDPFAPVLTLVQELPAAG